MATKLSVYNDAIRELGGAPLATLTDSAVSRQELDGAWTGAILYVLAQAPWSFALRRASSTGTADASFVPYTYRHTAPAGFLSRHWLRVSAYDPFEADYQEVGTSFYSSEASLLLEYVSQETSVLDPVNWKPSFTRCLALYLALLIGPKVARAGGDVLGRLKGQLDAALAEAKAHEAAIALNKSIAAERVPVIRRAIEIVGQHLAGGPRTEAQIARLRWQMNLAWPQAVRFMLEQGAWNFATRRLALAGEGTDGIVIEGYSVPPGSATGVHYTTTESGFSYGYLLPAGFRHKIWLKSSATSDYEVDHQIIREAIYFSVSPVLLEYVAEDAHSIAPANWPQTFSEAMSHYLAYSVGPDYGQMAENVEGRAKVAEAAARVNLEKAWQAALSQAKNKDALQQQAKRVPPGSFVRARQGASLRPPRWV